MAERAPIHLGADAIPEFEALSASVEGQGLEIERPGAVSRQDWPSCIRRTENYGAGLDSRLCAGLVTHDPCPAGAGRDLLHRRNRYPVGAGGNVYRVTRPECSDRATDRLEGRGWRQPILRIAASAAHKVSRSGGSPDGHAGEDPQRQPDR